MVQTAPQTEWDIDPFAPPPAPKKPAPNAPAPESKDSRPPGRKKKKSSVSPVALAAGAGAAMGSWAGRNGPWQGNTIDELAEVGVAWILFGVIAITPPTIRAVTWVGDRWDDFLGSRAAGLLGFNESGGEAGGEEVTGNSRLAQNVVAEAMKRVGGEFKAGVPAQCAFFVRDVLEKAGLNIGVRAGSLGPGMADSFAGAELGQVIRGKEAIEQARPGDIVMWMNTYTGGPPALDNITHVGIVVADGMMVHRPTRSAPVRHDPITQFPDIWGIMRPNEYGKVAAGARQDKAVDLIKKFEGFHPTPYWDYQQFTWGYGTRAPGPMGTISQEKAHEEVVAYLGRNCDSLIPESASDNQYAAAGSLCFNLGPSQFRSSDVYAGLQSGDLTKAANGFDYWVRAGGQVLPGLVSRRRTEKELFLQE